MVASMAKTRRPGSPDAAGATDFIRAMKSCTPAAVSLWAEAGALLSAFDTAPPASGAAVPAVGVGRLSLVLIPIVWGSRAPAARPISGVVLNRACQQLNI